MTKKEMAKVIADDLDITVEVTKEVIQRTFSSIIETLESEGRIELTAFGKNQSLDRRRVPGTAHSRSDRPEFLFIVRNVCAIGQCQ
jgi:nucleoid DNA-binding protein